MSDPRKALDDLEAHRHEVELESARSAPDAHRMAEIGGAAEVSGRNATPVDGKVKSLAALKIAMLEQLNAVYALAYAMTQCTEKAEQLSFQSFSNALHEMKVANCIACSPRKILFRSLYKTLRGSAPPAGAECAPATNAAEMHDAPHALRCGQIDWESFGEDMKLALISMPVGLRFILYLWAVEEVSLNELAEVLGVPAVETSNRVQHARNWLYRRVTSEPAANRLPS